MGSYFSSVSHLCPIRDLLQRVVLVSSPSSAIAPIVPSVVLQCRKPRVTNVRGESTSLTFVTPSASWSSKIDLKRAESDAIDSSLTVSTTTVLSRLVRHPARQGSAIVVPPLTHSHLLSQQPVRRLSSTKGNLSTQTLIAHEFNSTRESQRDSTSRSTSKPSPQSKSHRLEATFLALI